MRNTYVSGGSANVVLAGAKDTRVELRTSVDIKEKLRAAASLAGVDMSSFILMAATQAAQRAIDAERMRVVTANEWTQLNELLKTPHQPGDKLRNLMKRETRYERKF